MYIAFPDQSPVKQNQNFWLEFRILTISAWQTKTDICANSVEPILVTRLIRIYTVCHSVFDLRLKPLFASVNMSKFKDGKFHLRDSGMKALMHSILGPLV